MVLAKALTRLITSWPGHDWASCSRWYVSAKEGMPGCVLSNRAQRGFTHGLLLREEEHVDSCVSGALQ